jgi:diguanylate cyclase (GGDEF)-like protein/PAS domain S-box-containing protein
VTSGPKDRRSHAELTVHLLEVSATLAKLDVLRSDTLEALGSEAIDAVVSEPGPDARLITLMESSSFFRTLILQMQEGAASIDARGTIVYANPRFAELLALPLSQLMGRTLPELTAPGGQPTVQRLLAQAAGGPARAEFDLLRADGRLVPVSLSAAPIGGEQGEICLVVMDQTEQHTTQTKLRLAEESSRSAFDQAPIGMAVLGLDGRLERVNAAFAAITGRPEVELLGASLLSLLDRPQRTILPAKLKELLTGEHDWKAREIRYQDAAGRGVWVSESAALVRDPDGLPHHILLQVEDIAERRDYADKLEYAASHDPLTRLLNRRSFGHELAEHVTRVRRYGPEGALIVLDLDGFKHVNDTLGHKAGDELLLAVAVALAERLRDTDALARLGGDEFGVLLPRADRESAELAATALLEAIRSLNPPGVRRVSASAGIAVFADSATADEMLVRGDLAMFEAKGMGRDRIAFYEADAKEPGTKREVGMVALVEKAIAEGALQLHGQPIVDLLTGQVQCYELLIRIPDGEGGSVAAAEFVPTAERCGLIAQIDRWVVERAFELLEAPGTAPQVRLAANVSAKSLDEQYVAWVERRLAANGVDPTRLTFELTESAAISSYGTASAFARRLQELGCELALDDFGAGFGSFTYLRRLPFDVLKIDGEFVRNCTHDSQDRTLVEAMVRIAGSLGKRTVAEFVGDQETADALRAMGVNLGQGYHFGRPAPIEEVLGWGSPANSGSPD